MKNKKRISVMLFILIIIIFTTSCGFSGVNSQGETKEITDCTGNTVSIPKNPKNVVCAYATTAHIMAMLGKEDKIVGVPNGVKHDELMKIKMDNLDDISVPIQNQDINIEEVLNLGTDLILVRKSTADDEGQIEKLNDLGIPYVVIDYTNIKGMKEAIRVMGAIFDEEDRAQEYIKFCNKTISMVKKKIKNSKDKKNPLVYHSVNEAIRTDASGGICEDIMTTAGVIDASADKKLILEGDKTYATIEEIYKWNPDGIIANEYSVTEYILSNSKWSGMVAVKNKNVYTLPVGVTRWCHPGSMEAQMGVLAVAYQFYPRAFKDFDIENYVKKYYKKYFNLKLKDEAVRDILSGKGMRQSNGSK